MTTKLPSKLTDITSRDLTALFDYTEDPENYTDSVSIERVRAVAKLLKGKIRWGKDSDDEAEVLRWLYKHKSGVFKYIYDIPLEEWYAIIQSKVKLPKIKEYNFGTVNYSELPPGVRRF